MAREGAGVTTMRASALLAAALTLLATHTAAAETRTVRGDQLVLSNSLSEDVVIGTDPSLSGQVRVSMDRDLSCLAVVEGPALVIGTSRCDSDAGGLRIDVSPNTSLTITSNGDGNIRVSDLRAPLVAELNGDGDLAAGRTGSLTLAVHGSGEATTGQVDGPATIDIAGSGDVRLKAVHGPLTVKQVGSGELTVGDVEAGSVMIEAAGSGDILLGSGHIRRLQARLSSSGDLSVAAAVHDAEVEAHGGGDIKLAPVSGTLTKSAGGGSSIEVGQDVATATDAAVLRVLSKAGRDASKGNGTPSSDTVLHVLTAAFVALVLYMCWRIVRRSGGLGGLRRQFAGGSPAAPTHPGVLALSETMGRLDQRLGRLESYVTTREFDLARKFRDLGR